MTKLRLRQTAYVFLLMTLIFTVFCQDITFANESDDRPPAPTEGTPAENPNYGTSSGIMDAQATKYIRSWNASIENVGGNKVQVSGYTKSYAAVDNISVTLYLQMWDPYGKNWRDVSYKGKFTDNSTSYVFGSASEGVSAGNYYRTRSVHYVKENGTSESVGRVSDYIYIN